MGQGSINMPAPGARSPFEAISQALQAAHAYYGIDTEKAQQKLLDVQTRAEESKAKSAERKESMLADFMRGKMGMPPGSQDTQIAQPGQTEGTQPAMSFPNGTVAATGTPTPMPTQVAPTAAPRTTGGGIVRGSASPFTAQDLSNPAIAEFAEPSLKALKTQQETDLAAREVPTKLTKEFNEQTKGMWDQIGAYKDIQRKILSGNTIEAKAALTALAKQEVGGQRVNPWVADLMEDPSFLGQLQEKGSLARGKGLSPEYQKKLIDALNMGQQSVASNLDAAAQRFSGQMGSINNIPAGALYKNLLPAGTQIQPLQAEVFADRKTGEPALHILNGKTWKTPKGGSSYTQEEVDKGLAQTPGTTSLTPGSPVQVRNVFSPENIEYAKNMAAGALPYVGSRLFHMIAGIGSAGGGGQ